MLMMKLFPELKRIPLQSNQMKGRTLDRSLQIEARRRKRRWGSSQYHHHHHNHHNHRHHHHRHHPHHQHQHIIVIIIINIPSPLLTSSVLNFQTYPYYPRSIIHYQLSIIHTWVLLFSLSKWTLSIIHTLSILHYPSLSIINYPLSNLVVVLL